MHYATITLYDACRPEIEPMSFDMSLAEYLAGLNRCPFCGQMTYGNDCMDDLTNDDLCQEGLDAYDNAARGMVDDANYWASKKRGIPK